MQEAYRNCDERLLLNLPLPGSRFEGVATSEELAFNVTVALWAAKADAAWTDIMVENFKVDQSCDVAKDSAELPPQVSLEDVSGVFYILAAFAVGAFANACLHNQGCRQGETCATRTAPQEN